MSSCPVVGRGIRLQLTRIPCHEAETERRGRDSNPRWTKPPIPVFETGLDSPQTTCKRVLSVARNWAGGPLAGPSVRGTGRTDPVGALRYGATYGLHDDIGA